MEVIFLIASKFAPFQFVYLKILKREKQKRGLGGVGKEGKIVRKNWPNEEREKGSEDGKEVEKGRRKYEYSRTEQNRAKPSPREIRKVFGSVVYTGVLNGVLLCFPTTSDIFFKCIQLLLINKFSYC